ncbi:sterol desaturase family protein [Haliea sp. E1-2-M8]|uniref:sterol desaturase family protein n=1 Tax=Haliea sp. E1-2-M8 TaxID=3064706 RepID=UPI0027187A9F|nr:sterol desaturase family protein [Haliea sp. E1-2-M8]MDO8863008.1 sterol desaturase family protein [Haliea sp. E1-2-M8]
MDFDLANILAYYHWQEALLTLAAIIALTKLGKFIAFRVPALAEMRRLNLAADKEKLAKPKYPPVVRASQKVGLAVNLVFFLLMLPWFVTLESQPLWMVVLHVVVILMVYDFFYYLCHRFWFHGNGKMRQVHAVHHQARSPTHIDGFYVHPLETFVGIALFVGTMALLALGLGPFHVATVVVSYVIFTQINTINHTAVTLPYFPFRTVTWVTAKHHVHHENMHKGNYATITLLYDYLFGTLD